MPDTAPIRSFLSTTTSEFVEIAAADLLELVEAAERSGALPPRVPPLQHQVLAA